MKRNSVFRTLVASSLVAISGLVSSNAEEADFNEVGKQMSIMLQNRHYNRLPFDEKLSERIFNLYVNEIDYGKIFFTQEDIDGLKVRYASKIHDLLLEKGSIAMANEVHALYRKRVADRIAFARKVLKEEKFSYDSDREIMRSRRDTKIPLASNWPANEAAAEAMWRDMVEDAMLSEKIRRITIEKRAKEQGKENPLKDEKSITSKLDLRYERILHAVTEEDAVDTANGLLSAVAKAYDPHTDYFSFREMQSFLSSMNNGFVGIGALLEAEEDGATKIRGVVVGGPADKGGELKLNDRVIGVDTNNTGEVVDIMFMKIDKVVELIRGKEGSSVRLKVEPADGGESKFIVIQRGKVEMKDEFAKGEIIEQKGSDGDAKRIGIITLPAFYANFETGETRCSVDVEKLLLRMNKEKVDGLVLDLRGNGGGSLEEVRRMTGFFTGAGPVCQVKDYRGNIDIKAADEKAIFTKPMIVMIDKTSASASEILAGALQDYNRAVVVGSSSTFGKGTVQQTMDIARMMPFFSDRERAGVLKPTIQKFYRVAGSSTQNKGVESDIVLPDMLDAIDVGESFLYYALDYDQIDKAPGFEPSPREGLFIAKLKGLSTTRVNSSKDFAYLRDDITRTREKIEENTQSLNLTKRLAEVDEVEERTKKLNKERIERFAQIEKEDKKNFTFYRMNLDDLAAKSLPVYNPAEDDESYMRRSKDELEDLDVTPEWPSRIDPVKREGIHILNDLIGLTNQAKMAGVIRN